MDLYCRLMGLGGGPVAFRRRVSSPCFMLLIEKVRVTTDELGWMTLHTSSTDHKIAQLRILSESPLRLLQHGVPVRVVEWHLRKQ